MAQPTQARNGAVFARLAQDYDRLNDVMTAGLHRAWRRQVLGLLGLRASDKLLDLAAGTGDMAVAALPLLPSGSIILVDSNPAMLAVARNKLAHPIASRRATLLCADAHGLPFPDDHFDHVVIGFGLRLDGDVQATLGQASRVLTPGGRCVSLDLSNPESYWFKPLFDLYLHHLVPRLARCVVRKRYDYHYLPESADAHPDKRTLKHLFERNGFAKCEYHSLLHGAIAIHVATKARRS